MLRVVQYVIVLTVLTSGIGTVGSVRAQDGSRIRQLRDEVREREEIARDLQTPESLRTTNRNLLLERRAQLRTLLAAEIENVRAYKVRLGTRIAAEESRQADRMIENMEAEIKKLSVGMQADLTAETANPVPDAPAPAPALSPSPTATPGESTSREASSSQPVPATRAATTTMGDAGDVSDDATAAPAIVSTQKNCEEIEKLKTQNPATVSALEGRLCDAVERLEARRAGRLLPEREAKLYLSGADDLDLLIFLIAKKNRPAFLVNAEEARIDKQVGAGPGASGSTSLVVKGGAPAVLGFAVENGALTQSISGTNVTFRGNPLGIYNALAGNGFIQSVVQDETDPLTRALKKTSFAFSFNTDRGREPSVLTADRQQLSSFSVRHEFINNRNAARFNKQWEGFLVGEAQRLTNVLSVTREALLDDDDASGEAVYKDAAMNKWFNETQAALLATSAGNYEAMLRERVEKLPVGELSPEFLAQLGVVETALSDYLSGRKGVLDKIAKGSVVTLEYTNQREVNAPDLSNFRFIGETGIFKDRVDLTSNASFTFFNSRPAGAGVKRIRDFQFAAQLDIPFGDVRRLGQFVFSAGGRYERLMEDAMTPAGTMMPNTKGDIGVGQLKLIVPIRGTGFKIPISVTFANRTELIKEREVRGNFGFTFDLDTLFTRFNPFSPR